VSDVNSSSNSSGAFNGNETHEPLKPSKHAGGEKLRVGSVWMYYVGMVLLGLVGFGVLL